MAKMTDDELRQVIDHEVSESAAWAGSVLAGDRERNLQYYYGLPMGNEVDGRSQVVSWDVFEVIESAIPSLLEPFFAGDHIGECEPASQGDEEYADQATDYINYLIKKKNDGFITFNTWVKDGLLSKVGIVRAWWDATRKTKKESYKGLTDQQLTKFTQDDTIKIVTHDAVPDPDDEDHREQAQAALSTMPPEQQQQVMAMLQEPPKMLHDIDIVKDSGPRGVRIDNVPPEAFILSRHAKKIADVSVIGELRRYTRSDLVEMGYDKARIAELNDYDVSDNGRMEALRNDDRQVGRNEEAGDDSMQKITMFFGFVRVDFDGDGIAEWRRVFMGGNDLLENEEVDDHEYCIWSPILLPHRIIGMALADPVISIQDTKTALTRQYLDSLYIANNPTTFAIDGKVNLDDLLSTRIGRVVRIKELNAVGPLTTSLVANESLQGIELANSMREERIGVSRLNQGLDADALNKTATGAKIATDRDQKREKMMLRVFAETGVKDLFKRVLKLTCEYQDKPSTIRMRDTWVEYDPRNWSSEMDVNINVGLGTGDKSETVQFLGMMATYFQQAMPLGIVRPENIYNLGKMLLKAGNIQGGEAKLLTDPASATPVPQQKTPEQTLAEAELQIEQMRQQGKMAEAQQKKESDAAKLQADTTLKHMDLQLKEKDVRIKEIDLGLKSMELQHKMGQENAQMAAAEQPARDEHLAQMVAGLHDKLDQHAQMETHIVRGPDGRASHAVKRLPAPEQQG
jgi:hypothetical protein